MEHSQAERVHTEAAVLDIGEGMGALVIYTDDSLLGREIEVSPEGQPHRRIHTEVLKRRAGSRSVVCACFAELPTGEFQVWGLDERVVGTVSIEPGIVSEIQWKSGAL